MASLPSSETATPPPSTVHSSVHDSSWDPLLLSETDARGSDESPCNDNIQDTQSKAALVCPLALAWPV